MFLALSSSATSTPEVKGHYSPFALPGATRGIGQRVFNLRRAGTGSQGQDGRQGEKYDSKVRDHVDSLLAAGQALRRDNKTAWGHGHDSLFPPAGRTPLAHVFIIPREDSSRAPLLTARKPLEELLAWISTEGDLPKQRV